jgi:NADPH:quinone reductase-like Zn-dependent oxidoreductase
VHHAGVRAGQHVLVHAAAGGVGHLAVQIAARAYVIGTARSDKHGFLRDLGADELIDYTITDFTSARTPGPRPAVTVTARTGPEDDIWPG